MKTHRQPLYAKQSVPQIHTDMPRIQRTNKKIEAHHFDGGHTQHTQETIVNVTQFMFLFLMKI